MPAKELVEYKTSEIERLEMLLKEIEDSTDDVASMDPSDPESTEIGSLCKVDFVSIK